MRSPIHLNTVSLLLLTITALSLATNFNVTDDTYFEIKWPGLRQTLSTTTTSPESKILNEAAEEENSDSVLVHADAVTSYRCYLPNQVYNQKHRKTVTDYKGPEPLALLRPLFEQKACSYKIESYWTYELCHGKHLRQYHEDLEGEKTSKKLEFYLGYYHSSNNEPEPAPVASPPVEETTATGEKKSKGPPVINIEGTDFPYFRINFTGGSVCDLTKQPRQVELLYICLESGRGEIYELVETESCKYRVVVMSKLLCQHPSYTIARPHVNSIKCRPADASTPDKPRSLIVQELLQKQQTQASHTSTLEGLFGKEVKIEATRGEKGRIYIRVGKKAEGEIEGENKATGEVQQPPATEESSSTPPERQLPSSHPPVLMLQRFLSGTECVVGGAGWWRHELCYGKHVIQYHDDATTGKRTTIVLGKWNEKAHLDWAQKTAHARPMKNKQFSHLFTGGDRCDETKRARTVEVRIRCMPKSSSSSAIAIMLQEPTLCEYILTVESSMLCPLVNQVDKNGLLAAGDLKLD